MKIASHAILSNASATRENCFPHYDDFLTETEQSVARVDALTGISPELMAILQDSNRLCFGDTRDTIQAGVLLQRLKDLQQVATLDEIDIASGHNGDALLCVLKTAETYRQAAILYIQCRVLGFVNPAYLRCVAVS